MHVYLAGTNSGSKPYFVSEVDETTGYTVDTPVPYLLESYYYMDDWQLAMLEHDAVDQFMLDSGAFTFMEQTDTNGVGWGDYVDQYADFINRHDAHIDHFFELDIDSVVGYDRVKQLRQRLETATGRDSIPVWHKSRGKDAFLTLCDDYDYVAIGGIAGNEITRSDYKYLRWFIDHAHDTNTAIHGLGFTPSDLDRFPFDSVDSKSWVFGRINGTCYQFTGTTIESHDATGATRNYRNLDRHNLREWLKYVRYMADKPPHPTETQTQTPKDHTSDS